MRLVALLCLLFFCGTLPSRAADSQLEYRLKAVFLLDFAKFIDWPSDSLGPPDSAFGLCVIGPNPFGGELDQVVSGEAVLGRKVTIQKFDRLPVSNSCRIAFFGGADAAGSPAETGNGILTVGEGTDFVRKGGMIAFVIENGRVRFEINQRAAEKAGLKLRSGLLAVAKSVLR